MDDIEQFKLIAMSLRLHFLIPLLLLAACDGKSPFFAAREPDLKSFLQAQGLVASNELAPFIPVLHRKGGSGLYEEALFRKGGISLRAEIYKNEGESAEGRFEGLVQQILTLYSPLPDPYFSRTSAKPACPEKFQPKLSGGTDGKRRMQRIDVYGNARANPGVCIEKEAETRISYVYLYCAKAHIVLKFILSAPIRDAAELERDANALEKLGCG